MLKIIVNKNITHIKMTVILWRCYIFEQNPVSFNEPKDITETVRLKNQKNSVFSSLNGKASQVTMVWRKKCDEIILYIYFVPIKLTGIAAGY